MPEAPDKLSLVVYSGDFAKVHYALVMAAASIAVGRPTTLFFTMEALRALAKAGRNGQPGWRALPGAATMDDSFVAKGVAGFEELLTSSAELGARFMVCDMGLRALNLTRDDLRSDIAIETGGVVTFLADASRHGAMLFI